MSEHTPQAPRTKPLLCKVCGITRPQDMELCHSLGVDFAGMIFVERSPRFVTPTAAAALPSGSALRVGVFAGADLRTIQDTIRQARLDLIQLHGDEDVLLCRALGPERVIKVLWPQRFSPEALAAEMERFAPVCAYFLLEAGLSGGGSGAALPWDGLRRIAPPRPWLLAGGLGPQTLGAALAACHPDGVDLNSALESAPGVKDHDRVRSALILAKTCSGPAAGHTLERLS